MDYVATDTVKYPEWVADDRCDTNLGTVRNAWRREWRATDALHDVNKSLADSFRGRRAGVAGIIGRDVREISKRLSRPYNLHPRLNFAKVASTSASVATSPRSIEARAASMLRNSPCVATYSPPTSSLSISLAIATNSFWASSGQV
jgi:hypothetical protein